MRYMWYRIEINQRTRCEIEISVPLMDLTQNGVLSTSTLDARRRFAVIEAEAIAIERGESNELRMGSG